MPWAASIKHGVGAGVGGRGGYRGREKSRKGMEYARLSVHRGRAVIVSEGQPCIPSIS